MLNMAYSHVSAMLFNDNQHSNNYIFTLYTFNYTLYFSLGKKAMGSLVDCSPEH